ATRHTKLAIHRAARTAIQRIKPRSRRRVRLVHRRRQLRRTKLPPTTIVIQPRAAPASHIRIRRARSRALFTPRIALAATNRQPPIPTKPPDRTHIPLVGLFVAVE